MAGQAHLDIRSPSVRPGAFPLLIVVALIAAVSVAAAPAQATVSGQDGRIAYVTEIDGDMEIYSVNPDGSDPINLTNTHSNAGGPIDDSDPAWSPDGRRLAFTRVIVDVDADEPSFLTDVWVMDADGSNQELVLAAAWDPAWSPDGTRLAVVTSGVGAVNGLPTNVITVVDVSSGAAVVVTDPGTWVDMGGDATTDDRTPVWAPDEDTIYFARSGCPATPISCTTDLMAVDLGGPGSTPVTRTVIDGLSRWSPAMDISPDGEWLVSADTTVPGPVTAVVRHNLTDGTQEGVISGYTTGIGAAYAPSNGRIAVVQTEEPMTPPMQVWTVDLDGSDPVHVVEGWDPAWQPVNPYPFGMVDPGQGQWYLRHPDAHIESFFFGNPGDVPFMGDWDCDGVDTPGLYRQSDGYVYLRNSNTQGIADISFFFGNPGDVPIAGDFDGDGCATVSLYRPSTQTFYIINRLGDGDAGLGAAEMSYVFGDPGDKPFVGDFDGDGLDTVGLHRESTGLVYFRNTHTQGVADNQFIFGDPGDRLVAHDWNGDGTDSPGLFRPDDTTVFLRFTNTQGTADAQWITGNPDWLPVIGDFE